MKMKNQDFRKGITTDISIEEAFNNISSPNKWWTANFKGSSKKLNDIFTLEFGENKFTFKVIENIPNKKLVWLTIDCFMPWLNNKTEWNNTKIVFEFSVIENKTQIDLTHIGLLPEVECYDVCKLGWNQYFGESIPSLLATGSGILFDD